MSDGAHIIEIERLILTGTAGYRSDRLHSLIAAEVQRVLTGAGIPRETGVAGEVANSVTQAVRGGER